MSEPILNSTATATLAVGPSDLASALALEAQDAFPAVLATARMVALMEIASARLLQPHLTDGELSMGVPDGQQRSEGQSEQVGSFHCVRRPFAAFHAGGSFTKSQAAPQ